jgi:DNA-binding winged helix-turn-helix (wHTH) protein
LQYLFDDYLLDVARHELRRGEAIVPIEPQVFDLLAFLVRNRDRVVSRDELLAAVWDGRVVSDSTFTSRVNSARSALNDNGEDQRLIRTVQRRGYRFVGSVVERDAAAVVPVSNSISRTDPVASAPNPVTVTLLDQKHDLSGSPKAARPGLHMLLALAAGVAIGAAVTTFFFINRSGTLETRGSIRVFDASAVPLVGDEARRSLSNYLARPEAKALAISRESWSVVDGAADMETARREALRQCAATTKAGVCRIYAAGAQVVWSQEAVPLPANTDLKLEPLQAPLVPNDIPWLNAQQKRDFSERYLTGPKYKAVALTTRGFYWTVNSGASSEAVRIVVERCADVNQRPCLLLAVDNHLTIQIPKSRGIARIFLPSHEADLPAPERERIARIYQGQEWRALARGRKGTWHPIAGASSEDAAIAAALKSCAQADEECQLYAIGNFRVGDE